MSNKSNLDQMCPSAAAVAIGTRLQALIDLANDLRDAWSGTYTVDDDEHTFAAATKALVNELKAFAGDVADLVNETKASVNVAVAIANETKAEFNKLLDDVAAIRTAYEAHRVDETAHAAADTTNTVAAMTSADVESVDAAAVAGDDLGAIASANLPTLEALTIGLPAIQAPAVDGLDDE